MFVSWRNIVIGSGHLLSENFFFEVIHFVIDVWDQISWDENMFKKILFFNKTFPWFPFVIKLACLHAITMYFMAS